jgi:2-hydroxychromene-2-carboxylate isomerase
MANSIDFIFDFGSPNAYLAHKVLPDLRTRTGAEINYIPCLLGGIFKASNNRSPIVQFADVPARRNYDMLEMQRFVTAHKLIKFQLNPHFPINTLLLMRAAVAAHQDGVFEAYVDAAFAEMWENGTNMGDLEIAAAALASHGLDGAALLARTQDQTVKDVLVANTEGAITRGVFGIPTFFVGDDMFFGKDRLGQVEAALS